MNWISRRESLYKVWTKKHPGSKFIVLQHGAYVGGVVTDVAHKYTKCDIFLTWGSFFTEEFIKNNYQKGVKIISFGNTIYNELNRGHYSNKENRTNAILLLPTALDSKSLKHFNSLIKKLEDLNFQVFVKEHSRQGTQEKNGIVKYPSIEGVTKLKGQLYSILQNNDFDFIIADHSTSLLDAIFFKNKVLYFDPNNNTKSYTTNYSNYLSNIYLESSNLMDKNSFYKLIDIESQERLFNNMISLGNNQITI